MRRHRRKREWIALVQDMTGACNRAATLLHDATADRDQAQADRAQLLKLVDKQAATIRRLTVELEAAREQQVTHTHLWVDREAAALKAMCQ